MSNSNEYMAKYMLARYHRRMSEAKAKLGGQCAKCGAIDKLELDHVDPLTKLFTIGTKLASVSEAKYQAEIIKCQLLCHDCHNEKTVSELTRDVCKNGHKRTIDSVNKTRGCKQCVRDHTREWKRKNRK